MKMIIEISGGNIANIVSENDVDIYIIDHDNLRQGENPELIKNTFGPDIITSSAELIDVAVTQHFNHYIQKAKGE